MTHTCTYTSDTGDLVIEFDYQPAERQTRDYPGCDADVEITAVYANGQDISYWVEAHMDFFREKCFESVAQAIEDDEYDRGEERYYAELDRGYAMDRKSA